MINKIGIKETSKKIYKIINLHEQKNIIEEMEIIFNKKFIFWIQLKQKLKIKITKIIIEITNFLKKNIFLPLHLNWKIINKGNLVKKI